MRCQDCLDHLVEHMEALLDPADRKAMESHLAGCPACRKAYEAQVETHKQIERETKSFSHKPLAAPVLNRIVREQTFTLRKINRHRKYKKTGWGIAAAAVLLIGLFTVILNPMDRATAAEILSMASRAASRLNSVYMEAMLRSPPKDNFEYIDLECGLVPVKMWKAFHPGGPGKWRIEKPDRVAVMDGNASFLFIRPNFAVKGNIDARHVVWLKPLMDVHRVLESELRLAEEQDSTLALHEETGTDDASELLVVVEAKAQGDFTNDWCRNKSISASDNRRIYRFDAKTKFLKSLEVYVHAGSEDVLVFRIDHIVYDAVIDPAVFSIRFPDDVIWSKDLEPLPDNGRYENMTPEEAVRAFFQSCADRNWEETDKFWPFTDIDERMKDSLGGIDLVSIGEAFKSGAGFGWYVPYRIRKGEESKEHNLHVYFHPDARRYIVNGGL